MRKTTLCILSLLFVALALLGTVFTMHTAKADDVRKVSLNGAFPVQYGVKVAMGNSVADGDGYIRGTFNPDSSAFEFTSTGAYCIAASDIYVYTDPLDKNTALQLADAQGKVKIGVGDYYFALKSGSSSYILDEHIWTVRNYATKEPTGFVIDGLANTSNAKCVINRQVLKVSVDVANSTTALDAPLQTEGDYLLHEYGAQPDKLQFAISEGALYGGDTLDIAVTVQGNDTGYGVGDYTTENVALTVKTTEETTSNNYTVQVEPIHVRVFPKDITVTTLDGDTFNHTDDFRQDVTHPNGMLLDATSQLFYIEKEGVDGQTLRVYFDLDEDAELAIEHQPYDAILQKPIVGIGTWAAHLVGCTVDEDKEGWSVEYNTQALNNYNVRAIPADGEHYTITVQPQSITIYNRHFIQPGTDTTGWVDIADLTNTSAEYGNSYNGQSATVPIQYDSLQLQLQYEIEIDDGGVQKTIAAYMADHGITQPLRLDAQDYSLKASVDDMHYNVTVHDSLRWTITPQHITYTDLAGRLIDNAQAYSSADKKTGADFSAWLKGEDISGNALCLAQFAFDIDTDARQVACRFYDKQDVAVDVGILVADSEGCLYPGFYCLQPTSANYVFDNILYLRVLPVATAIVVPSGAEYDGNEHPATVRYTLYDITLEGNQNKQPVDTLEGSALAAWHIDLVYNGSADAPIDAGNYSVQGKVVGPTAHNPWLAIPAKATAKVAQKPLTVKLSTTVLSKDYGDEVSEKNIHFSPTKGVGNDRIRLSCAGWDSDAEPGLYAIVAEASTDNYDITLLDAMGNEAPRYRVNKLGAVDVQKFVNTFVEDCVESQEYRLQFEPIRYYGQTLGDDVQYQYRKAALDGTDNPWLTVNNDVVTNLEEGTTYQVRLLATDGDYVNLNSDIVSTIVSVTTSLSVPTLQQDIINTGTDTLALTIADYSEQKQYALFVLVSDGVDVDYDNGTVTIQGVTVTYRQLLDLVALSVAEIELKESNVTVDKAQRLTLTDGDNATLTAEPLQTGAMYYALAIHKTLYSSVANAPLAVYTRTAAPNLSTADLTITLNSITPPAGYSYAIYEYQSASALPLASTDVTFSLQELKLTYQLLEQNKGKIFDMDGQARSELMPNHQYVLAVWQDADDQHFASDVLCLYVRTVSQEDDGDAEVGALAIIGQYTLLGLGALNLLLFVICLARFLVLRHKSIQKYSLTGGRK